MVKYDYYVIEFKCRKCGAYQEKQFKKGTLATQAKCINCENFTDIIPESSRTVKIDNIENMET